MSDRPYSSDLTDEQWASIEPLIPKPNSGGRQREIDMREVVNAIRYLLASGCKWRELPDLFPNRSTVRHYFDAWKKSGVWDQIHSAVDVSKCDERELRDI
jgi:transposase